MAGYWMDDNSQNWFSQPGGGKQQQGWGQFDYTQPSTQASQNQCEFGSLVLSLMILHKRLLVLHFCSKKLLVFF